MGQQWCMLAGMMDSQKLIPDNLAAKYIKPDSEAYLRLDRHYLSSKSDRSLMLSLRCYSSRSQN